MLSDFLTEAVFTKGVSVSDLLAAMLDLNFSDLRSGSSFPRRPM